MNKFLTYFRRKIGKLSYVWFLEFQQRGAPHFHILSSRAEPTGQERKTFAEIWAKIVARNKTEFKQVFSVHIHPRSWEAIRDQNGAEKYALSYALKPEQKTVPSDYSDVGQFWSSSRDVIPKPIAEQEIDEQGLRNILAELGHPAAEWELIPQNIVLRNEIELSKHTEGNKKCNHK